MKTQPGQIPITEDLIPYCETPRQEEVVQAVIDNGGGRPASRALGIAHSNVMRMLKDVRRRALETGFTPLSEDEERLDTTEKLEQVKKSKARTFVITCAQNATPVYKDGLQSLKRYCEHNNAELIVIPVRYRNPTSRWTGQEESHEWWAPEITPHLLDHRVELSEHLVVLGDIRVQPTAVRPTSGLETFCGGQSAILGHPKLEMVTIPAPQHSLPKTITTTGAITVDNYSDTKAGKKGEHHHTFGALVVEIDRSGVFYMRQLNIDEETGSFYDLDVFYRPDGLDPGCRPAGLVLGDLHERFVDPGVVKATFTSKGSMINKLRPEAIAYHDVADFYSQNHHHRGKVFTKIAKHAHDRSSVEDEIDECAAFIDRHAREDQRIIFVPSNHPDALCRWVEETDWRSDPENSVFYLKTAVAMAETSVMTESGASHVDPFVYWMKRKLNCIDLCEFPARDESVTIAGIEVGFHGDKGPNGSRGAIRGFGRIGVKSVIGHSHTPGVMDGVYQVGTSSRLRLEYNTGPSSWLHCHCLIYPNGKRSLVMIIDGKWRPNGK